MGLVELLRGFEVPNLFTIEEHDFFLGEGKYAYVLAARWKLIDELVALKILKEEYMHKGNLFIEESKKSLKLSSPYIVPVYLPGSFEVEGFGKVYYLPMKKMEKTLDSIIGSVDKKTALVLTQQVLEALEHAKEKGILHGDLHWGNIFVEEDPTIREIGKKVLISDWGLALVLDSGSDNLIELSPSTKSYFSQSRSSAFSKRVFVPQETIEDHIYDEKSEVFQVGALLANMIMRRLDLTVEEYKALRLNIDEKVRRIIDKSFTHNRNYRFSTLEEMSEAIYSVISKRPVKTIEVGEKKKQGGMRSKKVEKTRRRLEEELIPEELTPHKKTKRKVEKKKDEATKVEKLIKLSDDVIKNYEEKINKLVEISSNFEDKYKEHVHGTIGYAFWSTAPDALFSKVFGLNTLKAMVTNLKDKFERVMREMDKKVRYIINSGYDEMGSFRDKYHFPYSHFSSERDFKIYEVKKGLGPKEVKRSLEDLIKHAKKSLVEFKEVLDSAYNTIYNTPLPKFAKDNPNALKESLNALKEENPEVHATVNGLFTYANWFLEACEDYTKSIDNYVEEFDALKKKVENV